MTDAGDHAADDDEDDDEDGDGDVFHSSNLLFVINLGFQYIDGTVSE